MKRLEYEFPTEWSLCPDDSQRDWGQPPAANDQEPKTVEPLVEPRALAAGASGQP